MTKVVIEFAPLNLPIRRRLQTLAAAAWMYIFSFGSIIGIILAAYLVLFTEQIWFTLAYLVWIYRDKETCQEGGRALEWMKNWTWWYHFKNYFPIRLHRLPWIELNPSKNYLFCCFPHGLLPTGIFSVFLTSYGEFNDYFPHHTPYLCSLEQHFHIPFFRELALGLGSCSSSATSLKYLLSKPEGGNAVGLAIGGVAEAYYCKPRQYKLVLKNRKGFIKIAIQNGSPLVPVFSFGEVDLFDQINVGDESTFKKWQERIRKVVGMAPIFPIGRGFFQYSFGIIPKRRPVNVVVGKPIEVEKVDFPTREQVDGLHEKFVQELINLFEDQKHSYIKDAENIHIELV